jgi:hypothetical protein
MIRTIACLAAISSLAAQASFAQEPATQNQAAQNQTKRVDERVIQMLEKSDINRDGDVTRQEFKDYRNTEFPRLNRNQDDYISKADFAMIPRGKFGPDVSPDLIDDFDANKDGKVSRKEFDEGPTLAFNRIDRDHNGIATRYEIALAQSRYQKP